MRGSNLQTKGPNILYSRLRTSSKKAVAKKATQNSNSVLTYKEAVKLVLEHHLNRKNVTKEALMLTLFYKKGGMTDKHRKHAYKLRDRINQLSLTYHREYFQSLGAVQRRHVLQEAFKSEVSNA